MVIKGPMHILGQHCAAPEFHLAVHRDRVCRCTRSQRGAENWGASLPRNFPVAADHQAGQLRAAREAVAGHRPYDGGSHLPWQSPRKRGSRQVLPGAAHPQDRLPHQGGLGPEPADVHSGFFGKEGQQCVGAGAGPDVHLCGRGAVFVQWY